MADVGWKIMVVFTAGSDSTFQNNCQVPAPLLSAEPAEAPFLEDIRCQIQDLG